MRVSPFKINSFLMLKLPAAYLCGVRVSKADDQSATVRVRTKWINKNPFGSMYFAVQAMAAELSTGVLVMNSIRESQKPVSMLVTGLNAEYSKKAVGEIEFSCADGEIISQAVASALEGHPQVMELTSVGRDPLGDMVSIHRITWSLKAKHPLKS